MSDARTTLLWLGLTENKVKETLKNEALTAKLIQLIATMKAQPAAGELDRNVGKLIYQAATTAKAQIAEHLPLLCRYIEEAKIDSELKLTAALEYLVANPGSTVNSGAFEAASGVGVVITEDQVAAEVSKRIDAIKGELVEKRYRFNTGALMAEVKKALKFADGKTIKTEVDKQVLTILGPKTDADNAKPKKETASASGDKGANKNVKKEEVKKEEECKDIIELLKRVVFHSVGENYKTDGYVMTPNTMKHLAEHVKATGGKVHTRFPPEPNGILHIGHAKAININFGYALANGGNCYLRYDDTNPEKEEQRFVDAIHDMVEWLGYKPYKVTYSSDHFETLYQLAVKLIEKGLAYVCHQRPEELKGYNPPPSPYRNRSVKENLGLFEAMKMGQVAEGEATLRMKITLEDGKVDPVAYRIKMAEHHRTGRKWCIYPTYDFTHCLCDSLENITHSLCTKEFQDRRSSYYWLCNELDIYCPVQWEYSRLNVNYTVVSKRKIAKLIEEKIVDDWDDPRLFTLTALRRRGFPSQAINSFCAQMGLTVANAVIDPTNLEASVRDCLNVTAPRAMAVLEPIRCVAVNIPEDSPIDYIEVPDFPAVADSKKHKIPFTRQFYIEVDDFRDGDGEPGYRRLKKGQIVGLRHANRIVELVNVHKRSDGTVDWLEVKAYPIEQVKEKPKAFIHWVSLPVQVEVRLYERLFNHKNPEDPSEVPGGFLSDCNKDTKRVITNALVDVSLKEAKVYEQFQFERLGFFSVDPDSGNGKLVFNRTVSLKDGQSKN